MPLVRDVTAPQLECEIAAAPWLWLAGAAEPLPFLFFSPGQRWGELLGELSGRKDLHEHQYA